MKGKKKASFFQMESDSFFRDVDVIGAFGGRIDFAFLDGMHWFEFLLRDFFNTERLCEKNALIALHDCMPLTETMAHRDHATAVRSSMGSRYQGYWTGDVWKVVLILKKYRPDLKLLLSHAPPTGLVFVSGLDPESTVLKDNYDRIVTEFSAMPNDLEAMSALYDGIPIIGPATY